MPIVFVHGVNTRKTEPGYAARISLMKGLMQKHLAGAKIDGVALTTFSPQFPYWGHLATTFAWNMASLPTERVNTLGPPIEDNLRPLIAALDDDLSDATSAKRQPLLKLATRKTLSHAVQIVSDLLLQTAAESQAESVAAFIMAIGSYAEDHLSPNWLGSIATDEQFINKLAFEAIAEKSAQDETLGTFSKVLDTLTLAAATLRVGIQSAASTVLDRSGDFASTKLLAWQRRSLNEILGRFFGDIFIYLDTRGDNVAAGPIPALLLGAIDVARKAEPPNEPLIIIGHSLGGVICYDLFTFFRPQIVVDLLVTVGSQVSHFEEIKRLKASDPTISSPQKAKTPDNIKHWINIFDRVDIFSYACEKIFDRVTDLEYDTQTYVIKAHSAYLEQDRFYARLRERIDAL